MYTEHSAHEYKIALKIHLEHCSAGWRPHLTKLAKNTLEHNPAVCVCPVKEHLLVHIVHTLKVVTLQTRAAVQCWCVPVKEHIIHLATSCYTEAAVLVLVGVSQLES